jgi:hypothetical protein
MSSMPLGYDSILRAPYIAAELLIALAAVIGNLLVCLAVRWNRKLQTVTNYFLVRSVVIVIFEKSVARSPTKFASALISQPQSLCEINKIKTKAASLR